MTEMEQAIQMGMTGMSNVSPNLFMMIENVLDVKVEKGARLTDDSWDDNLLGLTSRCSSVCDPG